MTIHSANPNPRKAVVVRSSSDMEALPKITIKIEGEPVCLVLRAMEQPWKAVKDRSVCSLPEDKFDFLRYAFGRCYSSRTGRTYIGTVPSKQRVIRICQAITEETTRQAIGP
jgi:hypothetical protein